MFDTVLVANRGEIAVRVIRTLRALGIRSVAVYSDADAGALHVRRGRRRRPHRPGAGARELPVRSTRCSTRPRRTGAQAVHPGYGFLSENADFAARLRDGRHRVHRPAGRPRSRRWATRSAPSRPCRPPACRSCPGRAEPGLDRRRPGRRGRRGRLPGAAQAVAPAAAARACGWCDDAAELPRRARRRPPRGARLASATTPCSSSASWRPPAHRGAGARRRARQRRPPRRARVQPAAPAPEGHRGGAVAAARRRRRGRAIGRGGRARPRAASATPAPARSSSSSPPTGPTSSSSWR